MTLRTLSLALAAGLLATSSSFAQDTTGAIEGDVTDKTASAIVGARIVATNLETGFSKETTTNADGFYRLLLLPVGRYSVTISDPQFAALVRQPIQVNVSQTSRVNAKLELRVARRNRDRDGRRAARRDIHQRSGPDRHRAASWSICRSTAATSHSSACCRPGSRH